MSFVLEEGLTREAVDALSARSAEPEWLRRRRQEAWETFAAASWPEANDEAWRRVSQRSLNLDLYRAYAPAGEGQAGAQAALPAVIAEAAGVVIQHNSEGAIARLPEEWRRQGVLFTSLAEAVLRYPELVEPHLGRVVSPDLGKHEALHGALWSGGTFLYVPRNVEVTVPLYSGVRADADGLALFPHLLVVAEQGSTVTLFDDHASPALAGEALSLPAAELILGDGAHVRYTTIQRWSEQVREFGTRRALLGRDARLDWITVTLGSRQSKMRLQALFEGEGSEASIRGLYFPSGNEEFHIDTLQDHRAARTRSDLFFKGAVRDTAHAVYYGIIKVHPEAQRTDAYQQNRNLLLSDGAQADSIPILEIEANDVKCSHGATAGQLDPEQLFYLMSRGLPQPEAVELLVEAFFREILDGIPEASVREHVARSIGEKLRGK